MKMLLLDFKNGGEYQRGLLSVALPWIKEPVKTVPLLSNLNSPLEPA